MVAKRRINLRPPDILRKGVGGIRVIEPGPTIRAYTIKMAQKVGSGNGQTASDLGQKGHPGGGGWAHEKRGNRERY